MHDLYDTEFAMAISIIHTALFVCFVCLGGRQGEADKLNCDPLQRVGIPFFRDLASRPRTLLLHLPSMYSVLKAI